MGIKHLKIAVVSDIHCHPEKQKYSDNNTLLFSDKLRSPSNEHPVENLLEIIERKSITVDLVLSPGDFTHQSDKQGFFSGWSYVKEISTALGAKYDIIATIGNHDIDSRHVHLNYSFDIPKKVKQSFPIEKKHLGSFWDKGFTFIEEEDFQILVINSTHFHTHDFKDDAIDNPIVKGKVDPGQIEEIENYLSQHNNSEKIKIALCHHHPIKHSRLELGEYDFVENGENLLTVLGRHKFDLFIHGHKHDPWLRYYRTESGYQIPILASGSFSATNQISWINKFNYFHIIELKKIGKQQCLGMINTWTFKNRIGWKNDKDEGFYPYAGFGFAGDINQLALSIQSLLAQQDMLMWSNVLSQVPELNYLTPDEMDRLEELLNEQNIYLNARIGLMPKHVYYERV